MRRLWKNWFRKKDGSTAIEFSMLLIPYTMLSLGIIELSLMYVSASLLEGATYSAARMIRTGQLQQANSPDPEGDFRDAMCEFLTALVDCNDVIIEATPMTSYGDYAGATFDENGNMVSQGFDAGESNSRMLIRTAYRYNLITPLIGPLLSDGTGSRLFMSTIVLQVEPYEFQG